MAIQEINVSTGPNTGNGDPIRAAFVKINQNFTTPANAASRMVGTQAGNVMEVGAFGLGNFNRSSSVISTPSQIPLGLSLTAMTTDLLGIGASASWQDAAVLNMRAWDASRLAGAQAQIAICGPENLFFRAGRSWDGSDVFDGGWVKIYTSRNTTTDSNGFVKAASPIVQLFADKIELNDEAQRQNVEFEKLGVGDYLIKGSSGFAQEGWYIETPKDANGNVLFSVIYETLENGDISVKTYKKKFDFETVSIVADLDNPVDITENRWIDLRLQETEVTDDTEQ
ncbi:phage tail fiber protein [Acinetobacter radioresistens]|uniref:phage tail fiber protein n=1 Tax=Acinetobacter radioresistens TaxID=40216 RepID=UPI0035CCD050